jgi:tRNA (adenine37-N6)-methyltransferase
MESLNFRPIAVVSSVFRQKFGTPRQPGIAPTSWAEVKLNPWTQPEEALSGLDQFSHIWIIFHFHLSKTETYKPKIFPPRLEGRKLGVFATRSPHRPNSIGMSVVKLEQVLNDKIIVSGIDLVDGTPVLDVKPYIVDTESIPDASYGWIKDVERNILEVVFLKEASNKLMKLETLGEKLRSVIVETLACDPRPNLYRQEDSPRQYRTNFFFQLDNYDVQVEFEGRKRAIVEDIIKVEK